MSGLSHAFKEWAVVCKALAQGRQSIVLRKGGIAEKTDEFQVEHTRFWLYPTYLHQQRDGVTADALPLLEQAEQERPPQGVVRLTHFAEASGGMYRLHNLAAALLLGGMHCLSAATVKARFEYKRPGLFVLPVRSLPGGADVRSAGDGVLRRLSQLGRAGARAADGRGGASAVGRGISRSAESAGSAVAADGDGVRARAISWTVARR